MRGAKPRWLANLVYRAFTRIGDERVPDAKTLARLGQLTGPKVVEPIHERVVELAERGGPGADTVPSALSSAIGGKLYMEGSNFPQTDFGDACGGNIRPGLRGYEPGRRDICGSGSPMTRFGLFRYP
jgi:hypothetical protein